jgi:hypothetical protein
MQRAHGFISALFLTAALAAPVSMMAPVCFASELGR